jgi:oligopeptide/dipeptide ABC transporter ATP-binding protein
MVMYLGRIVEVLESPQVARGMLHPYSVALQSAELLYSPGKGPRSPILLRGEAPSAIDRPRGCRFAGRCPVAEDCRSEEPPLTDHGDGHLVACYRPGALQWEVR